MWSSGSVASGLTVVRFLAVALTADARQRKNITSVLIAALICEGETMAEYIEKEHLLDFLDACIEEEKGTRHQVIVEAIKMTVERMPSVDVVERKRGKWTQFDDEFYGEYAKCSVCGQEISSTVVCFFCPNCGADMRESNNE